MNIAMIRRDSPGRLNRDFVDLVTRRTSNLFSYIELAGCPLYFPPKRNIHFYVYEYPMGGFAEWLLAA